MKDLVERADDWAGADHWDGCPAHSDCPHGNVLEACGEDDCHAEAEDVCDCYLGVMRGLRDRVMELERENARCLAELASVDNILSGRPALDDLSRLEKIEKAISVAKTVDQIKTRAEVAESIITSLEAKLAAVVALHSIVSDDRQTRERWCYECKNNIPCRTLHAAKDDL